MSDDTIRLLGRYRTTGVLLDTNILLLYFVGLLDPHEITKFKRTNTFVIEDYYTLLAVLRFVSKPITTPNILTEVSNLLGQLPDHLKSRCFALFGQAIIELDERYFSSSAAAAMPECVKFGLTDTGITHLARTQHLVITDDFRLSMYLQSAGIDILNFNHLRLLNWK
jgi:rRNA-processing protein FCF1